MGEERERERGGEGERGQKEGNRREKREKGREGKNECLKNDIVFEKLTETKAADNKEEEEKLIKYARQKCGKAPKEEGNKI